MTTVKEIIDAIYDFAPLSLQESYDNCGLQTGDPDMASTGVLLAVDMTEELLDDMERFLKADSENDNIQPL